MWRYVLIKTTGIAKQQNKHMFDDNEHNYCTGDLDKLKVHIITQQF